MAKTTAAQGAAAALALVQAEFPNYHPLTSLVRMAHRVDVIADPKLEADIHKAILPYVAPKLSSIEVKAEVDDRRRVTVSLFEPLVLENGQVTDVECRMEVEAEDVVPVGNN